MNGIATLQPKNYKHDFWNAMRHATTSKEYQAIRALSEETSGSYLVPDEFEKKVIQKLEKRNSLRALGTVIKTSKGVREIPVESDYGTANWLSEMEQYIESDITLDQILLKAHKAGTIIKASEEIVNDAEFDLEDYLAEVFAKRFANLEKAAFINGSGTGQPTGILQGATLGKTGATGQTTEATYDDVIELFHSLDQAYRENATWLMSDTTAEKIKLLKDSTGNYLWRADKLMGKPVEIINQVPNMAAGAKSIIFGDISYYHIGERKGSRMRRLDELFSKNGIVGFMMHRRIDGKLALSESVVFYQNPNT